MEPDLAQEACPPHYNKFTNAKYHLVTKYALYY